MLWALFLGPYRSVDLERSSNLVPFATIGSVLAGIDTYGFHLWFINLFGNILTFIPLGVFLPLFFVRLRRPGPLLVTSATIIAAAEVIQYLANVGALDVDDLILNTAGTYMGYCLFHVFARPRDA